MGRRLWLVIMVMMNGCHLIEAPPSAEPSIVRLASPTPSAPLPIGWTDENRVMGGICFESAYDAAGRTFVIPNAEAHIRFYDLADASGLCRRPITRHPFDFTTGRALAGLWSVGTGCTAHHEVLDVLRDDAGQRIRVRLRFVTAGDCPYELVRPFWVGIPDAQSYSIALEIVP